MLRKITAGAFVSFCPAIPANMLKQISFTNALRFHLTCIDQSSFKSFTVELQILPTFTRRSTNQKTNLHLRKHCTVKFENR